MTDKKIQKRGKTSQQKGKEYEKSVEKVYNFYNSRIQNKEGYRIERNKDKDTGEIDIYFEYKLPNGMNKTLIECKYGKFEKKDMFAFIGKITDKGGNMHGIFVYNDEKYLTDGIKELAGRNNIELTHITMKSGLITYEEWIIMSVSVVEINNGLDKNSKLLPIKLLPFVDKYDKEIIVLRRKPIEILEKNNNALLSKEKNPNLYNDMLKIANEEAIENFSKYFIENKIDAFFISTLLDKEKTECFIFKNDENIRNYHVLVKYVVISKDKLLNIDDKEVILFLNSKNKNFSNP